MTLIRLDSTLSIASICNTLWEHCSTMFTNSKIQSIIVPNNFLEITIHISEKYKLFLFHIFSIGVNLQLSKFIFHDECDHSSLQ